MVLNSFLVYIGESMVINLMIEPIEVPYNIRLCKNSCLHERYIISALYIKKLSRKFTKLVVFTQSDIRKNYDGRMIFGTNRKV